MRVLIAGGSGFLGRNLLLAVPRDWEVLATYNSAASFPAFVTDKGLDHVQPVRVNLADEKPVESTFGGQTFDAIINLAGNVDLSFAQVDPWEDWRRNVGPILNLSRYGRTNHLVHFSSGAVYDGHKGVVHPGVAVNPRFAYAVSKLAGEHYALSFRSERVKNLSIVRFFGAYGTYEPPRKIFTKLVRAFAFDGADSFTVTGDGQNLIDAMYVDDAVRGILAVVNQPEGVITVDLGVGRPITIDSLVLTVAELFGIAGPTIVHTGSPVEYIEFSCSARKFERLYRCQPRVPLQDGLRRLAQWLSKQSSLGLT